MAAIPHLLFRVREGIYGADASAVREVVPLPELTSLAGAPTGVAGILNYRGRVIAVLDLELRLGHPRRAFALSDLVIVFEHEQRTFGLIVNEVLEVREIGAAQTDASPLPEDGLSPTVQLSPRIARLEGELVTLLSLSELLRPAEVLTAEGEGLEAVPPESAAGSAEVPPHVQAIFRERALSLAQSAEEEEDSNRLSLAVVELEAEYFGVDLASVREFADVNLVTPIPCCPAHVLGAVNLRGEILPLLDIRPALQLPAAEASGPRTMMVVQIGELRAGIVVDAVLDVLHLGAADTAVAPLAVRASADEHLTGTAPYGDRMLSLLDLPGIFARQDWIVNAEASARTGG